MGALVAGKRTWSRVARLLVAALLAMVTMPFVPLEPANAGVGFGVVPSFPTTVTIGQTGLPAGLTVTNFSDGAQAVGNVAINQLTMVPSCSNFAPSCAGGIADPSTFALSPTGVGQAGTACAGKTFNLIVINPSTGEVEFQPVGGPVVLGPPSAADDLDVCRIDFTFDVLKMPNHDSFPGVPGVQTNQVGFAIGTHQDGTVGTGSGSDVTTVQQAGPTIVTQATPTATVGQPITDTATLSGGFNPTGTITFTLFGPNDPPCAGPPVFTSTVPVSGNGNYTSGPFTPTAPGSYNWVATYSGDANNAPATSPCGAPNETSVVQPAGPTIVTEATPTATVGQPITDTATLSGGFNPTGTITFTLFGPNDPTCAGPPVFTSTVPVNGSGNYTSGPFTPTAPGSYNWVATYSGDANNAPATSPCGAPNETSQVTPLPTVDVQKTADPSSRPEPGGDFTYTVVVTNTSAENLTITSLTDSVYGDLTTRPGSTCNTAVGTVLAPGQAYICQFVASFTGPPGSSLTDVVTATAVNPAGVVVTDNDDAVVTITALADLSVTKTCDPGPVVPGDIVNCSVTVSNAGPSTAQNVSVTDDLPDGATLVGTPTGGGFTCGGGDPFTCTRPSLPAGTSETFTFSVRMENVNPANPPTNTVTVSSTTSDPDPDDNTAQATTTVVACTITGAGDIVGTEGNDVICGSAGPDRIAALGGNDVIFALAGDDQVAAGSGNDIVSAGEGNDSVAGEDGSDQLFGNGGGGDRLSGGGGDDYLDTVDGTTDDFAVGGAHVAGDTCVIDPGDSTAQCEGSTPPATSSPSTTVPTVTTTTTSTTTTSTTSTSTTSTVPPTSTSTSTTSTTTVTGPQACNGLPATIVGTPANDTILGTAGRDIIVGLGGNDRLVGGDGDDVICGGDGDDTIVGHEGNDELFGGNGNDTLDGGAGNDRLFGDAGADTIAGRNGDDALDGGADSDLCSGGADVDTAAGCESVHAVP